MNARVLPQALPRESTDAMEELLRRWDVWLVVAALALIGLGLVMVASASTSPASRATGDPLYYLWRQGTYVIIGLVGAAAAIHLHVAGWARLGVPLLLFGVGLLVLVLVPGVGRVVNGSMRWIGFGLFNLQPSEPMKLFVILYMAGYLVRRAAEVRASLWGFFKPVVMLGLIALLLLLEPDYGATVVLFATALGMLFLGGVPLVGFVAWVAVIGALLGVMVLAAPYRVERLLSFVNPWEDPFGSGFQLTQALIAFGRGEWFGVGLGSSIQKLFYLPEAHTDFLFAVLAEELGFAGVTVVMVLFGFLVWRCFSIAARAEAAGRFYHGYVAYGIGLLLALQAFVNIGVNMGVLPTKGLTLPLMSYGGSSMVVHCIALGLLVRIDHELRVPAA